jgi:hypothetical protein
MLMIWHAVFFYQAVEIGECCMHMSFFERKYTFLFLKSLNNLVGVVNVLLTETGNIIVNKCLEECLCNTFSKIF